MATTTKQWIKPHFRDISKTLEFFLLQFIDKKDLKQNLDKIKKLYDKTEPVQLSPSVWSKISNSESYSIKSIEQMERLFKRNRSFGVITKALGEIFEPKIQCPILMKMSTGETLLVEGETRLIVARAVKLTPVKVIILEGIG